MTIYSLEVYILLFHVFLQMNTYVDNFCEVKKNYMHQGSCGFDL